MTSSTSLERPPTPSELRTQLGRSYTAYEAFLEQYSALRPEWKYYGARSGWALKLFEKSRNLCFVKPYDREFAITFLLGKTATRAALNSELPEGVKQTIRDAQAYVEGRPVRLTVRSLRDLKSAAMLMAIKRAR